MRTHHITLIPGDGIGPEVTEAVCRIIASSGVSIEWDRHDAGVVAFERTGQTLPVDLIESIRRHKVALKDMAPGDTVIKYGVDIGKVVAPIRAGEHAHVHNIKTKRW